MRRAGGVSQPKGRVSGQPNATWAWRGYASLSFVLLSNPVGISLGNASLVLAACGLICHSLSTARHALRVQLPLIAFTAWATLSATWSDHPRSTARAVVTLGAIV